VGFIGKTHGYPVPAEGPEFVDQPAVQRIFWMAISRVNGGSGGLFYRVAV
jgi:hypothetical protein